MHFALLKFCNQRSHESSFNCLQWVRSGAENCGRDRNGLFRRDCLDETGSGLEDDAEVGFYHISRRVDYIARFECGEEAGGRMYTIYHT